MQQDQQAHILLASLLLKMGKSDQEIKSTFEAKGLSTVDVEKLLVLTKATLQEIEKNTEVERTRYANEMDEDKLEELVQKVTDWYANGDSNDHQVKESLKQLGVEEKYHQKICEIAYQRVRRATHEEGNSKIIVGVIVAILGLFLLFGVFSAGGGRAARILLIPFGFGLYKIYQGISQKNSI